MHPTVSTPHPLRPASRQTQLSATRDIPTLEGRQSTLGYPRPVKSTALTPLSLMLRKTAIKSRSVFASPEIFLEVQPTLNSSFPSATMQLLNSQSNDGEGNDLSHEAETKLLVT